MSAKIDLERLGLRGGQAQAIELELAPAAPVIGGESYPISGRVVPVRIEVSRTTSGHALRLLAKARVAGPCARCLRPASLELDIDVREVDQPQASDAELTSPYVDEGVLDPTAWLHDAITLAMPDKVLCRSDCLGLCEECGIALNDAPPGHSHERPLDPRFSKLRELGDGD